MKLIAEPWDCGPGGYQVGAFPPGWAEWNDKFRDTVRDFWKGDAAPATCAERLCASGDLFNHQGRRPWACVNFVTAHDGFTLNDVVTYNDKHNEANGEDNRDGSSDNRSWNCGVEGPTDDPAINALRERQMRNMLATLLLSQGTPMLLAGDEFGRTQQGNNNAYCQDNEISWLDWELAEKNASADRLRPEADRAAPQVSDPAAQPLPHRRVQRGTRRQGRDLDQRLRQRDGRARTGATRHMRCFGMLMDGRAQTTGVRQRGTEATMLLVLNAHHDLVQLHPAGLPRRRRAGRCCSTPTCRTRAASASPPATTTRSPAARCFCS